MAIISKPSTALSMLLVLFCVLQIGLENEGFLEKSLTLVSLSSSSVMDCGGSGGDVHIPFRGITLKHAPSRPKTFQLDPFFEKLHHQIDAEPDKVRCERYGMKPSGRAEPRRIFFASLVADETDELLKIHAMEAFDIYHTVAFVESNTTFMRTPRERRFTPDSQLHALVTSGLFGATTDVFVDEWFDADPDLRGMAREELQRESVMERWKAQGMQPEDIGIVSDVDEVFSRDFLRAAQVCHVDDSWTNDTCGGSKVVANTIQYESMPTCVQQRRWFHPDMLLGKCLDGIGDPTGRIVPERKYKRQRGGRKYKRDAGMGSTNYSEEHHSLGRYPLWSTQDYRTASGGFRTTGERAAVWGNAYHFHNFYDGLETLRHKYATYGHGSPARPDYVSPDFDLTIRCIHNLPDEARIKPDFPKRDLIGQEYGKPIPLYFQNQSYVEKRAQQMAELLRAFEKENVGVYAAVLANKTYAKVTLIEQLRRQFEQQGQRWSAFEMISEKTLTIRNVD